MSFTFKELVSSKEYKVNAIGYLRGMQMFVGLTIVILYLVEPFGPLSSPLLVTLLYAFTWTVIAVPIVIAMPFFLLHVLLVWKLQRKGPDVFLWIGHGFSIGATILLSRYLI